RIGGYPQCDRKRDSGLQFLRRFLDRRMGTSCSLSRQIFDPQLVPRLVGGALRAPATSKLMRCGRSSTAPTRKCSVNQRSLSLDVWLCSSCCLVFLCIPPFCRL